MAVEVALSVPASAEATDGDESIFAATVADLLGLDVGRNIQNFQITTLVAAEGDAANPATTALDQRDMLLARALPEDSSVVWYAEFTVRASLAVEELASAEDLATMVGDVLRDDLVAALTDEGLAVLPDAVVDVGVVVDEREPNSVGDGDDANLIDDDESGGVGMATSTILLIGTVISAAILGLFLHMRNQMKRNGRRDDGDDIDQDIGGVVDERRLDDIIVGDIELEETLPGRARMVHRQTGEPGGWPSPVIARRSAEANAMPSYHHHRSFYESEGEWVGSLGAGASADHGSRLPGGGFAWPSDERGGAAATEIHKGVMTPTLTTTPPPPPPSGSLRLVERALAQERLNRGLVDGFGVSLGGGGGTATAHPAAASVSQRGLRGLDSLLGAAGLAEYRNAMTAYGIDAVEDLEEFVSDTDLVTEVGLSRLEVKKLRKVLTTHHHRQHHRDGDGGSDKEEPQPMSLPSGKDEPRTNTKMTVIQTTTTTTTTTRSEDASEEAMKELIVNHSAAVSAEEEEEEREEPSVTLTLDQGELSAGTDEEDEEEEENDDDDDDDNDDDNDDSEDRENGGGGNHHANLVAFHASLTGSGVPAPHGAQPLAPGWIRRDDQNVWL